MTERAQPVHTDDCTESCNHCEVCGIGIVWGARCPAHYMRPVTSAGMDSRQDQQPPILTPERRADLERETDELCMAFADGTVLPEDFRRKIAHLNRLLGRTPPQTPEEWRAHLTIVLAALIEDDAERGTDYHAVAIREVRARLAALDEE